MLHACQSVFFVHLQTLANKHIRGNGMMMVMVACICRNNNEGFVLLSLLLTVFTTHDQVMSSSLPVMS
jgi:hypothetical protein